MTIDLSLSPWDRLASLAPPGSSTEDLQTAATRYAIKPDLYAALADLWEDAANSVDVSPDPDPVVDASGKQISKVSQDGITVEYTDVTGTLNTRLARQSQYLTKARTYRRQARPGSPLIRQERDVPWVPYRTLLDLWPDDEDDDDFEIPVF